MGKASDKALGQNSCQPQWCLWIFRSLFRGCGQNRRRAGAWSRGPIGDATAQARVSPAHSGALPSRSGVASRHTPPGTCSALRGTLCRAAWPYTRYCPAPPFASSTIFARNARVFHYV